MSWFGGMPGLCCGLGISPVLVPGAISPGCEQQRFQGEAFSS